MTPRATKGETVKVRLTVDDPEGISPYWVERDWGGVPRVGDKVDYHFDTMPGVVREVVWMNDGTAEVALEPGEMKLHDDGTPIGDDASYVKALRGWGWQRGPEGSGV